MRRIILIALFIAALVCAHYKHLLVALGLIIAAINYACLIVAAETEVDIHTYTDSE